MKKLTTLILTALISSGLNAATIAIDTTAGRHDISQYIYGTNYALPDGDENLTIQRFGGNRTTGYNWENNFSNAGEDWYNTSDNWLCGSWYAYTGASCGTPGGLVSGFHQDNLDNNMQSLITIQMAGYVSADQAGTVTAGETAPSSRWKEVVPAKGSAFIYPPDTSDNYVYMDEEVQYLVNTFGSASTSTGIKFYALDNEPALWNSTHPRIHPVGATCAEYVQKSIDTAIAIKDIDPDALVVGGVLFGWSGYWSLGSAPDWGTEGAGYNDFIEYYLDKMQDAEITYGRRLVDMISLHYYSEARGGGTGDQCRVTMWEADPCNLPATAARERMLAPRTLWENNYYERGWIGDWNKSRVPLLPKVINAINTYYPGTKIAFTEHNMGGGEHVSGGIALADTLGIFTEYDIYLATYWPSHDGDYTSAGFKIFRNYDGANSTYGDTNVEADSDTSTMTVYSSIFGTDDSVLHMIIINKYDTAQDANVTISSPQSYISGVVYGFDSSGAAITSRPAPSISGNTFTYSMPALSVMHFILSSGATPTNTPVVTATPTFTVTATRTNTPDWTATATPTITQTLPPEWIDNLDDGDNYIIQHEGRDGPWFNLGDGTGTQTREVAIGGPAGSTYALHYYGSGYTSWGSGVGFNFVEPSGPPIPYDVSMYDSIRFWARVEAGSSTALRIVLPNSQTDPNGGICSICYDHYGIDITLTTSWAMYQIPFSSITQQGWGDDTGPFDATTVYNFETRHNDNVTYDLWLDDFVFYTAPTPTVTPTSTSTRTVTATPSFTPSRTPTSYFSPTRTVTQAPSSTYTVSHTPSPVVTVTFTSTTVITSTFTRTPTQAITLTYTPTPTYTATPVVTFTITPTPQKTAMADLSGVYVYPSMYIEGGIHEGITFYNLTSEVTLRIYNLSGDLVYEAINDTPGGELFWRLVNTRRKETISAGIYIYVVYDSENNYTKGKILIIR